MNELKKTSSICPLCYQEGIIQKINASIIEYDKKIWIIKDCQKHGIFKEVYFRDVDLYKRWIKYKVTTKPFPYIKTKIMEDPKLYDTHMSQSMLTNLVITNRTDFFSDKNHFNAHMVGYVYEPTIIQLKELMYQTRIGKPRCSESLQITGGEPTLREDIFSIIQIAKDAGFSHIQVITNGIKLDKNIEYCQRLKTENVNTIYLRFNGTTNSTNPLIKYHTKVLENLRNVNLNVVFNVELSCKNIHETGKIVRFAINNIDIVRGVHFQPDLDTRNLNNTKNQSNNIFIDIIETLNSIEKEFPGLISRNDFYPSAVVYPISQLIEMLINEPQIEYTPHPGCGGSTLIFLDNGDPLPITRFINIDSLINFIKKEAQKKGPLRKLRFASSLVKNIDTFTYNNKKPEGFDLKKIAKDAAIGGKTFALRNYNKKTLIIGLMWYQDAWNLDIDRLQHCVIHCPTFEGIIPFCTYAGLRYDEKIQKKYSLPIEEWEKIKNRRLQDDFKNLIL